MLEVLFDIKAAVYEIHDVLIEPPEEGDEERRKMTPEEWRAEKARREDLDRRLLEMIERYRKLNAEKRAAGQ